MDRLIAAHKRRMQQTLEAFQKQLGTVRTGRASPAILTPIKVDYYGSKLPINQLATISVPEPRLITITPWDKSSLEAIEKAIMTSDVGLSPSSDGNVIRLVLPPLTEERREELVKLVQKMAEESRVQIRNIRREANDGIDAMEKNEGLSEDEVRRGKAEVQEMTDEFIEKIDQATEEKVAEVREI